MRFLMGKYSTKQDCDKQLCEALHTNRTFMSLLHILRNCTCTLNSRCYSSEIHSCQCYNIVLQLSGSIGGPDF